MALVEVSPHFSPTYASFFFEGIYRLWGRSSVRYSADDFPPLGANQGLLLLRVKSNGRQLRLCVAPYDIRDIGPRALEWADIYAKVNLDRSVVPEHAQEKLVAVGPTFGVRTWQPASAASQLRRIRAADRGVLLGSVARGFWSQFRYRVPEHRYQRRRSEDDYVFFAAWPWKRHADVNPPRARFIEECKRRADIRFEGGFAPRRQNDMPELEGLFAERRYSLSDYLRRMSRSAVAFNTPAVHDCLGWKLGEFLALGKAIITLPLTRELPSPLEHGHHLHVVDGSTESIDDALDTLLRDRSYRERLEVNARRYYEEWLLPERLIARLSQAIPRDDGQ